MTETSWLIELAVRGGVVLALAAAVATGLRSAAWRHLVLASALCGLIFLPVLTVGIPEIAIPVLPAAETVVRSEASNPVSVAPVAAHEARLRPTGRASGASFPAAAPRPTESSWIATAREGLSAVVLWSIGAGLLLAGILADRLRRRRLVQRAEPLDSEPWRREVERLGGNVRLLLSADVDVPVTWGVVRPVLLLPPGAESWSASLRRHVLLHELAHVDRCDAAVLGLARLACALHWFNPLAWWALRRLVREAELAADDRVLGDAAVQPSGYAGDLVEFARRLRRPLPRAASAMARRSSPLESRVEAILDRHRSRSTPPARRVVPALAFAGLVVLPVAAALRPAPRVLLAEEIAPSRTAVTGEARAAAYPSGAARSEPAAMPMATAAARPAGAAGLSSSSPSPAVAARPARASTPSPASARPSRMSDCGDSRSSSIHANDDRWKIKIRSGRCELTVESEGEIEFTPDDRGIARMAEDARLEIDELHRGERRRLVVTAGAGGAPAYRWSVGREDRPFDAEGRTWLAAVLPEIFRATGINADKRVARILAAEDVAGVLAEIELIGSDYVGRLYFGHLLDQAEFDDAELRAMLELAGRTIGSDYELAETLVSLPAGRLDAPGVGEAFVEAATTIGSDYELRRTLATLLERSTPTRATLDRMLSAARTIGSDFEAAELLVAVVDAYPAGEPLPRSYYEVANSIGSDYEMRRTLSKALERTPLTRATLDEMLSAAGTIGADFEAAELLIAVVDAYPAGEPLPRSYYEVAETIGSDFELRRALSKALERPLGDGALVDLLRAARSIGSDFELAELLVTVGRKHRLEGAAREAYIEALDTVGSRHEHKRAADVLARHSR